MKNLFDLVNNLGAEMQGAASGPGAPQSGAGQAAPAQGGSDLSSLLQGRGGLATGAVAGGLAGLLLGNKKSRKFAGEALKVGGLAVAGGLAFKAFQDWQRNKAAQGQAASPAPQPEQFLPPAAPQQDQLAHHLIGAMIAAAKADGHITPDEEARIEGQLSSLPLDEGARRDVAGMLHQPPTVDQLVSFAETPEKAAEIYTASLLVIDPDGPAEKAYLALLAARLGLEADLVAHMHAQVSDMSA